MRLKSLVPNIALLKVAIVCAALSLAAQPALAVSKKPAAEGGESSSETTMETMTEPTMSDTAPTIVDETPTLGEPAETEKKMVGPSDHRVEASDKDGRLKTEEIPVAEETIEPLEKCAVHAPAIDEKSEGKSEAVEGPVDCLTLVDAEPMLQTNSGELVPINSADGNGSTDDLLLQRLQERRLELDATSADLELRSALIDAAEKRLEERAAAVAGMEANIAALVDEKKAHDQAQIKSMISLYESMKPKEAAAVFEGLPIEVLVMVAQGMPARKMSPILAKMSPERARELTTVLAELVPEPAIPGADTAAASQVFGQ